MKMRKNLAALLCLLLALTLFASCAVAPAPAETAAPSQTAEAQTPVESAEPEPEPLTVAADGASQYVIVPAQPDSELCQMACEKLAAGVEAATGAVLTVTEEENPENAIFVSLDETGELGPRDYAFTAKDGQITVSGGTEYALYLASGLFADQLAENGQITVPADLALTVPYEPDMTKGSLDEIRAALADPQGRIMIAAHRGAHIDYPDNSIPAVEEAVKMGADLVEVDVHKTLDGQLVLCHDTKLSTFTDCAKYMGTDGYPTSDLLSDWTLEQLGALKLDGTEYGIPTFQEALSLVQGKALLLLDKVISSDDMSLAQSIYEMAFSCGAVDSLMYQHDSRFTMPDSFFEAIYQQTGIPVAHHIYTKQSAFMTAFVEGFTPKDAQIQSLQVSFTVNDAYTNPDYIGPMSENNRLFANTLGGRLPLQADTVEVWQTLCDAGFSMLQTDNPIDAIAFAESYEAQPALTPAA